MKVLITGGGGFLGAAIARQLLARGEQVAVLGRRRYPELEAAGAAGVQWDLAADRPGLEEQLTGCDAVIHSAALAGIWGDRAVYWAINVEGTRRLIEACRRAGVGRLVYTGSPSCTFDGSDHEGVTEADVGYPESFEAAYPESKAAAEALVLAANAPELATTSLRPHLIYGPGDPHLLPRVIARSRSGRLRIVGEGENRVGITYVDNAAAAHVQALDALAPGAPCAGRAYFVTDLEPVRIWTWINGVLEALGEPPVTRKVPVGLARFVGGVLEGAWELFGLDGEPPMTRFVAAQLSSAHWYDLSGARADFGYAPPVPADLAMERTIADLRSRLYP